MLKILFVMTITVIFITWIKLQSTLGKCLNLVDEDTEAKIEVVGSRRAGKQIL